MRRENDLSDPLLEKALTSYSLHVSVKKKHLNHEIGIGSMSDVRNNCIDSSKPLGQITDTHLHDVLDLASCGLGSELLYRSCTACLIGRLGSTRR